MRIRRLLKWILASVGVLILLLLLVSALNNALSPTASRVVEQLGPGEKARVAEVFHLQRTLGDQVWKGWGEAEIPFVVYNEEYAFLIGYADPPPGWIQVPRMIAHGSTWEMVPDDTFDDAAYYRQHLPLRGETPQNFTLLVGSRWTASLQSLEWMRIAMGSSFAESMPAVLRPIFPRGWIAQLFVSSSDQYIALALHESFHAYQGKVAPARLVAAEKATAREREYPFDDARGAPLWGTEANLLAQGVRAASVDEAREFARQFLAQREQRRVSLASSPELIDYERQREWLEGLAKYIEIQIWRTAAASPGYQPTAALKDDADFHRYQNAEENWSREQNQITTTLGSQEVRFYYSGMAQAFLLDRLMPDWKARILNDDATLEDLLRESLAQQ